MFAVPSWETGANALKADFAKSKTKKKDTIKNKKERRKNNKQNPEGKVIKAKHKVQNVNKISENHFKNRKFKENNHIKINKNPKLPDNKPRNRKEKNNFAAQQRINSRNQNNTNLHDESRKINWKRSEKKDRNKTKATHNKQIHKIKSEHETNFQTPQLEHPDNAISQYNEQKETQEPKNESIKEQTNKEINEVNKKERQKEKIRKMLEMDKIQRTPKLININSNKLRTRMLERLKAAQFRYLNEKLYTSDGSEAKQLFQNDPDSFHTYHEGYQQQLKKWPINPLDVIVQKISQMPTTLKIADMGCGEAALSRQIPNSVRSFDLVSSQAEVESCDMAHTPLLAQSMDIVVYCLALMGTTLTEYLLEANRVLKTGGLIMIAEVESRFDDVNKFIKEVERLGFKHTNLDNTHKVFYFLEFKKVTSAPSKRNKLPKITPRPCLYKRR